MLGGGYGDSGLLAYFSGSCTETGSWERPGNAAFWHPPRTRSLCQERDEKMRFMRTIYDILKSRGDFYNDLRKNFQIYKGLPCFITIASGETKASFKAVLT